MNLLTINDTHLGVKRAAGTTLESQRALSNWMLEKFEDLLSLAKGKDVLINGDLFDAGDVGKDVEFAVFCLLTNWCKENPENQLILPAGNHDLFRDSSKVSSFQNLCHYLQSSVENVVPIFDEAFEVYSSIWVVPHCVNQELFDAQLNNVLTQSPKYVFVHANYDNFFAREADHSLNVSEEVAEKFASIGCQLIFAHEHNHREIGNVHIIGNQIPSSISDCLQDSFKQYATLDDSGLQKHQYLNIGDVFARVDWRSDNIPDLPFIRVEGTAEYTEAADVIQKLKQFRESSKAFVITNAVRVGQMDVEITDIKQAESQFDVRKLVAEQLPEDLKEIFEKVSELNNE